MFDDDDESSAAAESSREVPAPAMVIEVAIRDFDSTGMAQNVAQRVAERVMREHFSDIQQMADRIVTEQVLKRLDEVIGGVVSDVLSRPMTPTDIFGRSKGAPCSVSDFIAQGAEAYLETHMDPNGRPTNDSFWRGPAHTRAARMVAEVIDKGFTEQMSAAVKGIKEEVRSQMRAAANDWLAKFQRETADKLIKA